MIIKRGGRTYWVTLEWVRTKPVFKFWSDQKWPFYHASYSPDVIYPEDVWQKFEDFIPKFKK